MTRRTCFTVCLTALLLTATSVTAHHSPTRSYRTDERATVDGVLVSIVLRSPHSYLEVRASDADRRLRMWAVECGDIRQVRSRIAEGALRPGDHVIITGEPSRDDGEFRVRLRRLVRPGDGWEWRAAER